MYNILYSTRSDVLRKEPLGRRSYIYSSLYFRASSRSNPRTSNSTSLAALSDPTCRCAMRTHPAHGKRTTALSTEEAEPTGERNADAYIMRWGHCAWRESSSSGPDRRRSGEAVCVWGGCQANGKEIWKLGVGGV